jgi:hypothetical protein
MNRIEAAIVQAAQEEGIDPATALAWASRESSFNPTARASKSIYGLFQMSGALRRQYGIGDTADPYEQTKGFARYYRGLKKEMASTLGRDPTDTEAYLGHHFGGVRGARTLGMNPNTPVSAVFTPYERSLNPHFDRAGTIGRLTGSINTDIDRRYAKFGGAGQTSAEPLDFSGQVAAIGGAPQELAQKGPEPLDFSGQVADAGGIMDKIGQAGRAAASAVTEKLTPQREITPPPVTGPVQTLGIRGDAGPLDFTSQVQG